MSRNRNKSRITTKGGGSYKALGIPIHPDVYDCSAGR